MPEFHEVRHFRRQRNQTVGSRVEFGPNEVTNTNNTEF
jgi:hypothetical protein